MLKNNSSADYNSPRLVGGDFMVAENNTGYSAINLVPEFPVNCCYRGNFHVISSSESTVSVYDTTFIDEAEVPDSAAYSGYVSLRWFETEKNDDDNTMIIRQRSRLMPLPKLTEQTVTSSGWLIMKMTRIENGEADYSFEDDVLGQVKLQFRWLLKDQLPEHEKQSDYLPVAGIIVTEEGIAEIIQQQYGMGTLWLPMQLTEESSSSSSSSSSSDDNSSSSSSMSESESTSESASDNRESSSSSEGNEMLILVDLHYSAVSDIDINGDGMPVRMFYQTTLSGSFTAVKPYPQGGYQVTLTGTVSNDYGDGEGLFTDPHSMEVTVFRNDELQRWEAYNGYLGSWSEYLNDQNSDDDIDYTTPIYEFPPADADDFYPSGSIKVTHRLIDGASYTPPENTRNTELIVTFTKVH